MSLDSEENRLRLIARTHLHGTEKLAIKLFTRYLRETVRTRPRPGARPG